MYKSRSMKECFSLGVEELDLPAQSSTQSLWWTGTPTVMQTLSLKAVEKCPWLCIKTFTNPRLGNIEQLTWTRWFTPMQVENWPKSFKLFFFVFWNRLLSAHRNPPGSGNIMNTEYCQHHLVTQPLAVIIYITMDRTWLTSVVLDIITLGQHDE